MPKVAVFNASQDTIDMLVMLFAHHGYDAAGEPWPAHDPLSVQAVESFVAAHSPDVIVFDISFPYDRNWERCREFHSAEAVRQIPIVLTTTNKRALEALVGHTATMEIVGKPYDLQVLLDAVARALNASV